MNWRAYVHEHLPRLDVSPEREIEIVDELAGQLEATFERARAAGAREDEAMARAVAEVPDWKALAATLGRIERPYIPPPAAGAGSGGVMTGFIQDLRYAVRALRRAPGFAATAMLTLALGIAATTIVYSIVDGILLRPLPIDQPDRVMLVRELLRGNEDSVSWLNFLDWRERQTSFSSFAAWRGLTVNLTNVERPRRFNARQVTSDLFRTLGVQPSLGRDFTAADDTFGTERTAIVSHGFWQRELGGRADAIGSRIMLDEQPVTVIGVLPDTFTVARVEDIFLPWGSFLDPNIQMYFRRGNHFGLAGIARLKDGVSIDAARAEIVGIARQLEQQYSDTNSGNSAIVRPLTDVLVSQARPMLYVLLAAVAAMLLIACVNLANLMLARSAARTQEMAVRRSLGAARWRLARQLLTECLLLATAGGVLGVALATAGFDAVLALLPPAQPRIHTIAIDGRVLFAATLATVGTGLLFGLLPALQAATGKSLPLMRSTRVTGTSGSSGRTRRTLLLAEVALALVLVTAAGLMLRTMRNLLAIDTGITSDQLVTGGLSLPNRFATPASRVAFIDRVIEQVRAVPGVANAAFSLTLPVAASNWNSVFTIEGQPVPERSQLPTAAWSPVTTGYFDTMGIRLTRGRLFTQDDAIGAPRRIVVNDVFARRYFGDNDPIGARVRQGFPENAGPWQEIVGVVTSVRLDGLQGDPKLQIYIPQAQAGFGFGSLVARVDGNPALVQRALERAVSEVDPNVPLVNVRTMAQIVATEIGNERLTVVLLLGFAMLSLLIAAVGVFGVTAYSVSQRTHEVGVRMALGARPSSVLALVLRQELGACIVGIVVGVASALMLGSLLESLLYGVTARDTMTIAIAAIVLFAVTGIACVIPARRATRVDPVTALRLD